MESAGSVETLDPYRERPARTEPGGARRVIRLCASMGGAFDPSRSWRYFLIHQRVTTEWQRRLTVAALTPDVQYQLNVYANT
jgi:hypothetical protein